MQLLVHRFAELFPLIEGDEFLEMAEDVRANGLRDRIELLDGAILDGRNRFNILVHLVESGELLGAGWGHRAGEPMSPDCLLPDNQWFHRFNVNIDGDPLAWVLSKNLKRRHLDESQRAMVAAQLKTLDVGRPVKPGKEPVPEHIPPIGGISAQAAAAMLNVGARSVERAAVVLKDGTEDLKHAVRQGHLAVSAAEKIARLPQDEQSEAMARALPSDHRAIMAQRREPDDSLDYFPTPPWATRALVELVLPHVLLKDDLPNYSVWEPACGEGHIADVLREYFGKVFATDVFDYGYGETLDFLTPDADITSDWIITNPPFGGKTEGFVLKALQRSRYGVAMFVPLRWLETVGRYERLFCDRAPTLIAFFAERVPLCKGRWNPDGDTATAYIWLVWEKYEQPMPPFWIPPGQREALTRPDDAARFTQHPVARRATVPAAKPDHETRPVKHPKAASGMNVPGVGLSLAGSATATSERMDVTGGESAATNSEIPREEASGTAREAPSTGCGPSAATPNGGIQSAPPPLSHNAPVDDALDIPAFLRRAPKQPERSEGVANGAKQNTLKAIQSEPAAADAVTAAGPALTDPSVPAAVVSSNSEAAA